MADILDRIVATKLEEIARDKAIRPENEVRALMRDAPPVRDFVASLLRPPIGIIAEVKKASPSAGLIRADFDPVVIAKSYEAGGADCLSVLTDEQYFQGSLDYLRRIRAAVELPILRKEFVISEYQIYEARAAGADAVLLIAEILSPSRKQDYCGLIRDCGMKVLLEIHDAENLDAALAARPDLLGVNNRNLRKFEVDLGHTLDIIGRVPTGVPVVSESGIRTAGDVTRLRAAGVRGVLVGESLMRQPDVAEAVRALRNE